MLIVELLVIVHALRDEHVLAGVDDFVHFAFHIAELILLCSQLHWLLQLANLTAETVKLFIVCHILHLQVVVVLNERFHLLLQSTLVHSLELVLESLRLV